MSKIFITGGAGFIGSHLADKLAEKGHDICVFDNFYRGNLNNLKKCKEKIKIVEADIRDYEKIKKEMKGYEIVFHLAAQPNVIDSVKDPEYSFTTNVNGTLNTLKAAEKNNIKKFIFSSSREVYGEPQYIPVDEKHPINPKNLYGKTKVGSEILCNYFKEYFNLNTTIIRITNVFGSRDKDRVIPTFIDNLKNNKDLIVFGGQQTLDLIWIEDVVSKLIKIMENSEHNGKMINFGSGTGTKVSDLASMIILLSKSKSKIITKEKRSFDVEEFIYDTKNQDIKTKKLEEGLKLLLAENLK